jgi:hypothetical protein
MLVKFVSSETGELMMFADMASTLLRAVGKETGRRGTFTREEMLPAAKLLREAVALGPRAWPLIDMLERSSKGDAHANIVWEAAADF